MELALDCWLTVALHFVFVIELTSDFILLFLTPFRRCRRIFWILDIITDFWYYYGFLGLHNGFLWTSEGFLRPCEGFLRFSEGFLRFLRLLDLYSGFSERSLRLYVGFLMVPNGFCRFFGGILRFFEWFFGSSGGCLSFFERFSRFLRFSKRRQRCLG